MLGVNGLHDSETVIVITVRMKNWGITVMKDSKHTYLLQTGRQWIQMLKNNNKTDYQSLACLQHILHLSTLSSKI